MPQASVGSACFTPRAPWDSASVTIATDCVKLSRFLQPETSFQALSHPALIKLKERLNYLISSEQKVVLFPGNTESGRSCGHRGCGTAQSHRARPDLWPAICRTFWVCFGSAAPLQQTLCVFCLNLLVRRLCPVRLCPDKGTIRH